MNGQRLARLLWLVAILSAGGLSFLIFSPVELDELTGGDVKPISVPGAVDNGVAVLPEQTSDIPQWNPFDPKGEPWSLVRRKPDEVKRQQVSPQQTIQVEGVTGVLRLPGLQGVMTDQGFVEVGELFSGAEVRQIGDGVAVFSVAGKGEQVIRIDPERDKRRASFQALGMPIFGIDREPQLER